MNEQEHIGGQILLGDYWPLWNMVRLNFTWEEYDFAISLTEDLSRLSTLKNSEKDKVLQILLTYIHEFSHFYHLACSPFGLFLYHLLYYNVILKRGSAYAVAKELGYLPLPLNKYLANATKNSKDIKLASQGIFLSKQVTDFITALHSEARTPQISCTTALPLFQEQVHALCFKKSFDISNLRYKSKTYLHSSISPYIFLTPSWITEAYCRYQEFIFIYDLKDAKLINSSTADHLLNTRVISDYVTPQNFIQGNLEKDKLFRPYLIPFLLDLAYNYPVDVFYKFRWNNDFFWEDFHPGWRLVQIVEKIVDDRILPPDKIEQMPEYCIKINESLDWGEYYNFDTNLSEKLFMANQEPYFDQFHIWHKQFAKLRKTNPNFSFSPHEILITSNIDFNDVLILFQDNMHFPETALDYFMLFLSEKIHESIWNHSNLDKYFQACEFISTLLGKHESYKIFAKNIFKSLTGIEISQCKSIT